MQISELVSLLACSWRFPPLILPSERGASEPLSRPGTQVLHVHLFSDGATGPSAGHLGNFFFPAASAAF